MKVPFEKRELAIIGTLLLFSFIVRVAFFPSPGYQIDTTDFMLWFQHAADGGIRTFYSNGYWCDYPPFNIYFFWLFGSLANALSIAGGTAFLYIMKLPANLFDLATAFLIFAFARRYVSFKWSTVAMLLYAFNPAVIYNAAVWGQFDAIYTFFLVLSMFLVLKPDAKMQWTVLAVVAFMLGVLTKPQSIALAPLFIYVGLRKLNLNWKGIAVSLTAAVATVFAVIAPFEWNNPITFISDKYFGAYSTYNYTTLNAFNIWAFGGMWRPDDVGIITPSIIGWIAFAALTALTLYMVDKHYNTRSRDVIIIFAAIVMFFGFFMLPTRIHERYLFPAMAMLALLFPLLKKARPLYAVLTATCLVNQWYVLDALVAAYPYGADLSGDWVVFIVSLINSATLVYVVGLMVGELRNKGWLTHKPTPNQTPVVTEEH